METALAAELGDARERSGNCRHAATPSQPPTQASQWARDQSYTTPVAQPRSTAHPTASIAEPPKCRSSVPTPTRSGQHRKSALGGWRAIECALRSVQSSINKPASGLVRIGGKDSYRLKRALG